METLRKSTEVLAFNLAHRVRVIATWKEITAEWNEIKALVNPERPDYAERMARLDRRMRLDRELSVKGGVAQMCPVTLGGVRRRITQLKEIIAYREAYFRASYWPFCGPDDMYCEDTTAFKTELKELCRVRTYLSRKQKAA